MTYFLQSARLGFRCWSDNDFTLARELWGNIEVTQRIGGPFTDEQTQARLQREIATQSEHGIQYWPIFLLTTDEHVGCCGLRPYKQDYEIGFHLKPPLWGQGYAVEAAQAVIAYAFDIVEAQGLFAGHHPANESSRRLLTKLGFEYTHDEYYAPTGLHHPSYWLKRK